jgi:hypothetical protein
MTDLIPGGKVAEPSPGAVANKTVHLFAFAAGRQVKK